MTIDAQLRPVVAALYSAPYDDFTSRRNDTVRNLRTDGKRELAAAVAKLRRPTLPLWTVNQLAKRQSDEVENLLETGATLREAQQSALGGKSRDASSFREAAEAERNAVEALVRRAAGLLTMTGHPANEPVLARVRQTLHSAATADDDVRAALAGGYLDAELGPAGFEAMGEVVPARPSRKPPEPESSEVESARHEARVLWREAQERERETSRLRSEADRLREEAVSLTAQAEDARRRAADADQQARNAERDAKRARQAADKAAGVVEKLERR